MLMRIVVASLALGLAACGKPTDDGATVTAPESRVASTEAAPASTGPANLALACAAPFTPDATAASLAAVFGQENVIPETIDGQEGEKLNVTAIYPSDPTRRIEVYFKDEEARTRLAWATVKEDTSAWKGPGGVKMGDGIEAVEAANGGVFKISGFDWDFGGYVNDWMGGKLGETAPGCHTVLQFKRDPANNDMSIIGEGGRASDLPAMRAAKPIVTEFGIRW